jgi:hypothetical protein
LSGPIQTGETNEWECREQIFWQLLSAFQEVAGAKKDSVPWQWLSDVAFLAIKLTAFLNSVIESEQNLQAVAILRETARLVPYWPVLARHKDPQLAKAVLSRLELASYGVFKPKAGFKLSTPINRFCWQLIYEIRYLRSLCARDLAVAVTIAASNKSGSVPGVQIDQLVALFRTTEKIPDLSAKSVKAWTTQLVLPYLKITDPTLALKDRPYGMEVRRAIDRSKRVKEHGAKRGNIRTELLKRLSGALKQLAR